MFIKLTLAESPESTLVQTDNITYIIEFSENTGIYFTSGKSINVKEKMDEIHDLIAAGEVDK
jgi:hypothetical protein